MNRHRARQYLGHFGGDDVATVKYDGQSAMFYPYRDMRGEANDLLEKGNTMMEIVLVNHVLVGVGRRLCSAQPQS